MTRIPAAQLWVGSAAELSVSAHQFLRELWCSRGGCGTCITCAQVTEHRYYALHWLRPQGAGYLVEQLEELMSVLQFMTQSNEQVMIVFDTAHALSAASASRLLKVMEEPPTGYHFLLLTDRADAVLPTIRSRCVIREFGAVSQVTEHALARFLLHPQRHELHAFGKELEQSGITELESRQLLDALIAQSTSPAVREIYARALAQPPVPGSVKLFWRNLFLQLLAQ